MRQKTAFAWGRLSRCHRGIQVEFTELSQSWPRAWRDGHLPFLRAMASFRNEIKELQAIVRALVGGTAGPSVLATLATVEGSSYRRPGARLHLTAEKRGACRVESLALNGH